MTFGATSSEGRSFIVGVIVQVAVVTLALSGCRSLAAAGSSATALQHHCQDRCAYDTANTLDSARAFARRASRGGHSATADWLHCATSAYRALGANQEDGAAAAELATQCTEEFLSHALAQRRRGWNQGRSVVEGAELEVEFRNLSPYLQPPLQLQLARDVSMAAYHGERHAEPGFGVALAILTPRCEDAPLCRLLPPEGVFRGATAWIEMAPDAGAVPRLVLADPLVVGAAVVAGRAFPLAVDTSAAWARGAQTSKLHRLGVWGLLGGTEVGRRAGVYLLEDYDPDKQPLVMIHGLGSSPLMWARLSNAVWGDPGLRSRFQVWHVVYQTNAPLLITRRRVKDYLDDAWRVLDPDGNDPARQGMVLVGHSLGGVLSRMLCVDSGDTLLDAAFVKPPAAWQADASDRVVVEEIFRFAHYPGVTRAIFLAAPHRGSPRATNWFGRLVRVVVGRRAPEVRSLRRLARSDPAAIQPSLLRLYQRGAVNSISTLQRAQPVRAAGEALRPAADIPYHTIAGSLPGRHPETDGVVPLSSAVLEGAASTLVIPYGHDVYDSPEAVAEVLRILRLQDRSD